MQGEIRIDLHELAEQYGIKDLREARILPFSYGRQYTLVLMPQTVRSEVVDGVEIWFPPEVTG